MFLSTYHMHQLAVSSSWREKKKTGRLWSVFSPRVYITNRPALNGVGRVRTRMTRCLLGTPLPPRGVCEKRKDYYIICLYFIPARPLLEKIISLYCAYTVDGLMWWYTLNCCSFHTTNCSCHNCCHRRRHCFCATTVFWSLLGTFWHPYFAIVVQLRKAFRGYIRPPEILVHMFFSG